MSFFVGFPLQAREVLKYGVEQVFDDLERTGVNHVMNLAQDPEGSFFQFHEEYYAFTRLKPTWGDYIPAGVDPFQIVCKEAEKRGMKVYAHNLAYESAWPGYWPAKKEGPDISSTVLRNFTAVSQIDIFGRKNYRVCTNHPDYRQFYLSSVEDQLRSYPIEGIKFNMERNGPLSSVLV